MPLACPVDAGPRLRRPQPVPTPSLLPHGRRQGRLARLARNLRAEIDETRIETYRGTVSLPFEPSEHGRAAVKIVDDRSIKGLKIVEVE